MAEGTQEEQTRQEVREAKRRKKRQKMKQHGKGLAKMYRDAIIKRGRGRGKWDY